MSGVATAIGAATVISAGSSYMAGREKEAAAGKAQDLANAQFMLDTAKYNKSMAGYEPYQDYGTEGLAKARTFDLMEGVGDLPSWDKEYTDRLGLYEESPGYTAQNKLARAGLSRSMNARGLNHGITGATAGEELSMKLRAGDYANYRDELKSRYGALKGEYETKRNVNKDKYAQLMDAVKIGQWGQTGSASLNTPSTSGQQKAALASGEAAAGTWTNTGQAISSGIGGMSGQLGGLGGASMFDTGGMGGSQALYYNALNDGGSDPFGPPSPK